MYLLDSRWGIWHAGSVRQEGPRAAYDPVALGESLRRYAKAAEKNLALLDSFGDQIQPLLDKLKPLLESSGPLDVRDDVDRVTIVYDRMVKAGLNLVKATDELSRLQSFLSGGPDTRPDLSSLGEIELRTMLREAIRALGVTDLSQL